MAKNSKKDYSDKVVDTITDMSQGFRFITAEGKELSYKEYKQRIADRVKSLDETKKMMAGDDARKVVAKRKRERMNEG